MEKNNIYFDLVQLQGEIRNAPFDSENAFQKYKYASLSSILDTIRPILCKNNFAITQIMEEVEEKTYLLTKLIHVSGESINTRMPLYFERTTSAKNPWHDRGSAITYARRYSICSLLAVNGDEDKDADGYQEKRLTISKLQEQELNALLSKVDVDSRDNFFKWLNITQLKDLTTEKYLS